MTVSKTPKRVTIFGGSGFLGRHIVRSLAARGYHIRVAVRRPDLAGFLLPMGYVGQISLHQANLRYPESVRQAVDGADHVINCVGLLFENGKNNFNAVHDEGARVVAEAALNNHAALTHISAIGADVNSKSSYAKSKAAGEQAVLQLLPDANILRPSVVFGPDDSFFNKFASMAQTLPFLPLIGGGKTLLQPIYVGDIAEAVARSVDGRLAKGTVYELGGRDIFSLAECLELLLDVINRDNRLVSMPFGFASALASVLERIPLCTPALSVDQVKLLMQNNVVSKDAEAQGRTLEGIGINPTSVEVILPTYLVRYRPAGQYTRSGRMA